ncbi:MAG: hypothetical protein WKF84_22285 [Pyrinomonadaceae bacterium]
MSLVLKRRVSVAELTAALEREGLDYARSISFVDVFEGGNLPEGKRSVTLRIEYRAEDRTLRVDEIDIIQARAVRSIGEKFGAELRQ